MSQSTCSQSTHHISLLGVFNRVFQLSFITCILSLRGLIDSSIQLANYQEIEHCTIPDMFTDSEGHHRARGGQMTSLVGLTHKDRQQFMLIFTHMASSLNPMHVCGL